MARAKHTQITRPSQIVPQASPVDAYVRPADPAPSQLHQLAEGLAAVDKGLGAYFQKRKQEQDDADRIRAEAAFHKNNQVGWAEAVKSGAVPANSSPIFMQAYKEQQGNLQGLMLRDKFNAEYQQWDGKDRDDPEAFQEFAKDFMFKNLEDDDPDILRGLNPHVADIVNGGYEAHSKMRGAAVYDDAVSTNGAVASEAIDNASGIGLETGEGTDYEALWDGLMSQREAATSSGILEDDYDKTLAETIAAKALEHGDPELLELLDKKLPGQDFKLSAYPQFRKLKQDTMGKLEDMAVQRMHEMDRQQEKADKEQQDSIVRAANQALVRNINAEIPEDIMKVWEKHDPMARTKFIEMRKKLLEGGSAEDPKDLLLIMKEIREGAREERINQLVDMGVIRTPEAFKRAMDYADRMRQIEAEGSGLLDTPVAKQFIRAITERTRQGETKKMLFGDIGLSDDGVIALQDFRDVVDDWDLRNPEASVVERRKAVEAIGQHILSRITPPVSKFDNPEYLPLQEGSE